MIFHFLRGQVPRDRSPKEIMWKSLEECDDSWEHLFSSLVGSQDTGKVIYWNGNRKVYYRDNFCVEWVHSLKDTKFNAPDVILARGGFHEYRAYLNKYPGALKIYYGANHGCIPRDGIKYDLVLVDCELQKGLVESHGLKAHIINKPAADIFKPMNYSKKYDCAYVAVHPNDKRKCANWVYETCPKGLKVLQLGNAPKGLKVPKNFTVKRVKHNKMPKALNKCKVLIAPYTGEDSGPRCITEAEACNVRAVCFKSVKMQKLYRAVADKHEFWDTVIATIALYESAPESYLTRQHYEDHINNDGLKELIHKLRE